MGAAFALGAFAVGMAVLIVATVWSIVVHGSVEDPNVTGLIFVPFLIAFVPYTGFIVGGILHRRAVLPGSKRLQRTTAFGCGALLTLGVVMYLVALGWRKAPGLTLESVVQLFLGGFTLGIFFPLLLRAADRSAAGRGFLRSGWRFTNHALGRRHGEAHMSASSVFLARNGEQLGPYSLDQLRSMLAHGQILPSDHAWHEGMEQWEDAAGVVRSLDLASTPLPSRPPTAYRSALVAARLRAQPQVVGAGSAAVVAEQPNQVAGLGTRWQAYWIDGMVLLAGMSVLVLIGVLAAGTGTHKMSDVAFVPLLLFGVMGLYFAIMHASTDMATVGKRITGLIVVGRDGQGIGFVRSLTRYLVLLISSCFFLPLAVAFFTKRRQGLHDLVAGTVVLESKGYDPALWDYDHLGKSKRGRALLVLFVVFYAGLIPVIGGVALLYISAYQDTVLAQVISGEELARRAETAVTEYFRQHGRFPPDNASAGLPEPRQLSDQYVAEVAVSLDEISVRYDGPAANSAIKGKVLAYVGTSRVNYSTSDWKGSTIDWKCDIDNTTLPRKYQPSACPGSGR